MAPRGKPVHAAVSGTIRKLFQSTPGGNTIYEFDEADEHCYYYAHLDRYAEGLREGMRVERGDIIAYVGSTGNADPSHAALAFRRFRARSKAGVVEGQADRSISQPCGSPEKQQMKLLPESK
jgi:hypothetical protein